MEPEKLEIPREVLLEGGRTPAMGSGVTSVQVKGKWMPIQGYCISLPDESIRSKNSTVDRVHR